MLPAIYLFPWGSLSIRTNLCFNLLNVLSFLVLFWIPYICPLRDKRKGVILDICKKLKSGASHKIRAVAFAFGCLIAALSGVKYGGLFYRSLERCKNLALKSARGNFKKTMRLTSQAQQDLGWWSRNITLASHFLHTPPVELTLFSDASLEGWGCTDGTSHVGGRWTDDEYPVHINVLELRAAKLTLLVLAPNVSHPHIRLMLDNTTAAAYIDKMGGLHSPSCNEIAGICSVLYVCVSSCHLSPRSDYNRFVLLGLCRP